MSIVVNQVTSPCQNVVFLQLLINFFPFFPLKDIKSVSIMEGEATPTRSVKEKEEETEEAREEEVGGIVVVASGVCMVAVLTKSL